MTGKIDDPGTSSSEGPAAERYGPNSSLTPSFDPVRILAQSPGSMIIAAADGSIEFASNQWFALTGYSWSEISNKMMTDFWDMPAAVVQQVMEGLRVNCYWEGELPYKKKNGERLWQLTAINAIIDHEGNISHFVQFGQDITEKKADERVLRESEEKYRSILNSMKEGYFEVDLSGRLTFYNTSVKNFLGRSREEIRDFMFRDYMTPVEAERVYAIFRQVYRTGEPSGLFDYDIVRKDGKVVTVEAVISLICDAEGRPVGFAGLGRDVTDRRQMEEALRKSEEKYRHIIESLEEGYSEIDLKGRFLYVNPSVCKKMGYSAEELIGLNYRQYVAPDALDHAASVYNRVYRTGEPARIKGLKTISGNGSVRISDVSVSLLRDADGAPAGFRTITMDRTREEAAEQALRESEEGYRAVLEASPYSIVILRLSDARYMQVNDAFCQRTGYSREEAIGSTPLDLNLYVSGGDRERLLAKFYEKGRVDDYEVSHKLRDGRVIHNLLSAVPLRFRGQDCMLVLTTDITELKKTQKALAESEAKYRNILAKMEEGYYEVDLSGTFTFINEAMTRIHGYTQQELLGMNNRAYTLPEDLVRVHETFRQVYRTGVPAKVLDYPVVRKDGSMCWIETSASLLKNEAGEAVGFYGISRDVTEKKRAEDALKESEKRFRIIFESARDGIYLKDDSLCYTLVNPAMGRLFGMAPEVFIGKTDKGLFGAGEGRVAGQRDARVLRGGIVETEATWQVGGEEKTFQSIKVPLKGEDDEVTGICGFVRDQTEKKRLEAQLLQAQKMEAIGTLAGGIAHDFSNLMQAILGYCQILLTDKAADSRDARKLKRIERATQQAIRFTRQLLTFGRKMDIQRKPVDLNQIVRQVRQLLKRTLPKMISIELRLAPSLFTVNADSGQLEQVLLNISVNARDAMPEGGRLIIETENIDAEKAAWWLPERPPAPCVMVTIRDTGCGMSEEVCAHIFEPFYTTKPVGEGTGLGLAMAYGIIDNHGGSIFCNSQPGEGTGFHICLPAIDAPVSEEPEPDEVAVARGAGETILVIDDEAFLREFVEAMLTSNGYRVMTAGSGEEGLDLYKRHNSEIQLVLLDLLMPGMGGRQCLAALKQFDPAVPIIVSSGKGAGEFKEDRVVGQASRYVQKPYDVSEMLGIIRDVLQAEVR